MKSRLSRIITGARTWFPALWYAADGRRRIHVTNARYFHVQRFNVPSDQWEIGSRHDFGPDRLNRFIEFYENNGVDPKVENIFGTSQVRSLLRNFLAPLNDNHRKTGRTTPDDAVGFLAGKSPMMLTTLLNVAEHALSQMSMLLREVVFEEIRSQEFQSCPSRKSCLFLCETVTVPYWWRQVTNEYPGRCTILMLRLTGTLHRGHNRFLESDTYSLNQFRANARNYWSSAESDDLTQWEILFHGSALVLEEYSNLDEFAARAVSS